MPLTLSNRKDILPDSVAVFKGNQTIDLLESPDSVTGLAPATLNSLEKLAAALNNDSGFFTSVKNALDNKASLASPAFSGTVTGITKAMVELGNVDNTSDAAKNVSTKTQTELDKKAPLASPTIAGTATVNDLKVIAGVSSNNPLGLALGGPG